MNRIIRDEINTKYDSEFEKINQKLDKCTYTPKVEEDLYKMYMDNFKNLDGYKNKFEDVLNKLNDFEIFKEKCSKYFIKIDNFEEKIREDMTKNLKYSIEWNKITEKYTENFKIVQNNIDSISERINKLEKICENIPSDVKDIKENTVVVFAIKIWIILYVKNFLFVF